MNKADQEQRKVEEFVWPWWFNPKLWFVVFWCVVVFRYAFLKKWHQMFP